MYYIVWAGWKGQTCKLKVSQGDPRTHIEEELGLKGGK
jgi:hypothetical protein